MTEVEQTCVEGSTKWQWRTGEKGTPGKVHILQFDATLEILEIEGMQKIHIQEEKIKNLQEKQTNKKLLQIMEITVSYLAIQQAILTWS